MADDPAAAAAISGVADEHEARVLQIKEELEAERAGRRDQAGLQAMSPGEHLAREIRTDL